MSGYSDFLVKTIECPVCKWVGPGSKMAMGESFGDGADKHCPVCDWRYGFVGWPMTHEFTVGSDDDLSASEHGRVILRVRALRKARGLPPIQ